MARKIKYIDTIIYYDGPQLIQAEDQLHTKYLCTLVDRKNSTDTYLCLPISPENMNRFLWGEVDLLTIIEQSETEEIFTGYTNQERFENLLLEPIQLDDIDPVWLPEPGLFVDTQPTDDLVIKEATERNRAIFHFSLNPPEARVDFKINADSLGQAIYLIQRLIKHAFRKTLLEYDAATRSTYNIPDNYELQVIGVSPGSFTVHMQNKAFAGLLGSAPIEKALMLLDKVNINTESAQITVNTLAEYGGHFVVAYRDLVKFMVDNDIPISYQWTTPELKSVNKRRITSKQAKPIYELLIERYEIAKEKRTITGTVVAINMERKTWGIRDIEEGRLHTGTVIDTSGESLSGITIGRIYEFNCEEELEEERSTGKEVTHLHLMSFRERDA